MDDFQVMVICDTLILLALLWAASKTDTPKRGHGISPNETPKNPPPGTPMPDPRMDEEEIPLTYRTRD